MANGSKFLKVTGILMIIFGSIAIVVSIIALMGIGALNAFSNAVGATSYVAKDLTLLYVGGFLALLSSVVELVAGIIGVANAQKPEKAKVCMIWGILVAVMCILGNIFTLIGGGDFQFFSLLTGLALPVLYIIGAYKNQQNQF
ncbi:MAG: hypothetical protein PUG48_02900 [Clostridia bacterium]|nr:hypothetical protein [Clostridia bacterium]